MDDRTTFGRLLRAARRRSLFTLESLAEASGVSVRAISDMERGKSLPRQATLGELMDALELDEADRRRLVQASARRTWQVPRQLPPDPAGFCGREEALAQVHGVTAPVPGRDGRAVVSAIVGMAGIGKTALAVHWAHRVADRFPDGQLYVNLRGFEDSEQPLDPGEALGGFLGALGVPSGDLPRGTDQREALFREHTASRQLIVVLDNAQDEEQVRPLLPGAAGCLTIITSRNRLAGLAAREGVSVIGLDVWTRQEALAALAVRIGEERCRAEPEAAARLTELCGFLPLAIAVVGAQLSATPGIPLRLAARELGEARLDALSTGDRRADVRAVFSWSYRALDAGTARVFRHLALHPGPAASVEAAASLVGAEPARVRRQLRALVSASLLSRDADGRYVLHDLVRAYGIELIERERDDRLAAEIRLMDYLRHNAYAAGLYVSRYKADPPGSAAEGVVHVPVDSREEALDWYRQEESTTAAVLRVVQDPRLLRHCVDLVLEWVGYNTVEGRWAEEITVERIALDAAGALGDPVAMVRTSAILARALIETGNHDDADEPIDVMLTHMHRLPDADRARAELNLAWLREQQRRFTEALQHARNALMIYRARRQPDKIGRALCYVSWSLATLGEYRQSIATCEEALSMLQEAGERRFEAHVWSTIGYAWQGLGDLDAAVAGYEKSLRLFGEVLDDYSAAEVWDHLASAQLERGDAEQARASWARAAELFGGLRVARAAQMRAKARSVARPGTRTAHRAGK
ncbi:SARP family transcriptional regulator [Streptomyces olivaceoviridis]|uniref:ATP-binding protein n=1 Tax=Streptomyces olivaceoviridis TaxID=1921 RepID=UPI0016733678|nr:helix-turn-helix domain-containing protein [Streptomyces olivaceoviridis]GGZ03440.1 SARP family transcriptional regulator [Streptomyces olivaceoviridis]